MQSDIDLKTNKVVSKRFKPFYVVRQSWSYEEPQFQSDEELGLQQVIDIICEMLDEGWIGDEKLCQTIFALKVQSEALTSYAYNHDSDADIGDDIIVKSQELEAKYNQVKKFFPIKSNAFNYLRTWLGTGNYQHISIIAEDVN